MDNFNPNEHLIQLKGKDYLPVAWRLVWFRLDKPDWQIKTQLVSHDTETSTAVMYCEIRDGEQNILATAYGSETVRDFKDYLEKAETKAVGRALGFLGYGTQFTPDFDEGENVVDTPHELKNTTFSAKPEIVPCDECGAGIFRGAAASTYRLYGKKLCPQCVKKHEKRELARV